MTYTMGTIGVTPAADSTSTDASSQHAVPPPGTASNRVEQEQAQKGGLRVALIGPHKQRRKDIAQALTGPQVSLIREFAVYPSLEDVPRILEEAFDIILVDLDSDPDYALDLMTSICCDSAAPVMVYSDQAHAEMLVRCMRAGAREYLTQPFTTTTVADALMRATVRRPTVQAPKDVIGKLLIFIGAKGGSGVTTIASNFALSLAQESGRSTLLIDLAFPLGDAAMELGVTAEYSTAYALENYLRLDSNFLSTLLVKHPSGLSILAAPDKYIPLETSKESLKRLLDISRKRFNYVVIDAGSRFGLDARTLFEDANVVYLVTQVNVPELRNSNRIIIEFFPTGDARLEIVLNRFKPRSLGIDEEHISLALTRTPKWKIPSDYFGAQRAQNTASPLALGESAIARALRQMARTACGLPASVEKKGRLSTLRMRIALQLDKWKWKLLRRNAQGPRRFEKVLEGKVVRAE